MSPTARTQKYLRDRGYVVANCERKIPATPAGYHGRLFTQDLFGFVDTLAVNEHWILAVQSTTDTHHPHRVAKAKSSPAFEPFSRHAYIEVWSWAKRGPRGKRKLWTLRRESLTDTSPVPL